MALLHTDKISHPANFSFAGKRDALTVTSLGGDVYRFSAKSGLTWRNPSQAILATRIEGENSHVTTVLSDGTVQMRPNGNGLNIFCLAEFLSKRRSDVIGNTISARF